MSITSPLEPIIQLLASTSVVDSALVLELMELLFAIAALARFLSLCINVPKSTITVSLLVASAGFGGKPPRQVITNSPVPRAKLAGLVEQP